MIVSNRRIIQMVNLLDLKKKITDKDIDLNLNQIGLTSLDFVKLVLMLEDCFGIENGEELLFDLSSKLTVNRIVERLRGLEN